MKAAQVSKAGGDWELVDRDIPEPGVAQVRVKVEACGICHSDVLVKDGLSPSGLLLVPAAPAEPLTINMFSLISHRSSVAGWYSGTARDSQDTLEFSAQIGVHPMIEKFPLGRVAEAYEQMHSGKARFRAVLTM